VLSGSNICPNDGHWCGYGKGTPQSLLFSSTDLVTWAFKSVFWKGPYHGVRCAFFRQPLRSRMPLVPTPARLKLLQACDQWHSSRVVTLLLVDTVNCVQTHTGAIGFALHSGHIYTCRWTAGVGLLDGGYGARFRQKFTFDDAIGSQACSLVANMRATTGISPGCPLFLPVHTVNCVQTLKARNGKSVLGAIPLARSCLNRANRARAVNMGLDLAASHSRTSMAVECNLVGNMLRLTAHRTPELNLSRG
jgi:hypothetical protein